ncbi:MAG: hypothetical protein M0Z65_12820 [Firmicutes bacterium]|uniref:Uncharacterized protein n=1 Tax=Melghirimyces thermohalophilus TaxID=1236220 RepID=A0A1G6JGY1_9BACL|nr:hypothetical protein [Melghirimyces thermohalophilus]MDA8354029.1 hypothetical protein [Bacillota bacterium]SDC17999.1 hypothetical protein SAMN04488112_10438 [Melghirimyces thermohalophilus]
MKNKKRPVIREELPVPAGIIPLFLLKRKKKTSRHTSDSATQKKIH